MAKQSGGMPKIDEDFMKELISQGVPSKEDNKPNDAPHTNLASQVTQEEQQTETVRVEKTTNRKRKGGSGDYRETYFQKVELADRQPLYVSRTTHEKLMRIVTVIGGRKVTVSSYVENILLRHFEQYQDEINTPIWKYGKAITPYGTFSIAHVFQRGALVFSASSCTPS